MRNQELLKFCQTSKSKRRAAASALGAKSPGSRWRSVSDRSRAQTLSEEAARLKAENERLKRLVAGQSKARALSAREAPPEAFRLLSAPVEQRPVAA